MHNYEREYDNQLIGFREGKILREEAGYRNNVKVYVSSLISRGENQQHIASMLEIDVAVVTGWYRSIYLNNEELAFGIDEFTYNRKMNVLSADARTKGCIVKAVEEGTMTAVEAAEAVGVNPNTVNNWINEFRRDYHIMITLPPGAGYKIDTSYVYGVDYKNSLQETIFAHDIEENMIASQSRAAYIANRT